MICSTIGLKWLEIHCIQFLNPPPNLTCTALWLAYPSNGVCCCSQLHALSLIIMRFHLFMLSWIYTKMLQVVSINNHHFLTKKVMKLNNLTSNVASLSIWKKFISRIAVTHIASICIGANLVAITCTCYTFIYICMEWIVCECENIFILLNCVVQCWQW